MADAPPNRDELVSQFVDLAGVSPEVAEEHLAISSWDLASAVTQYYNPAEPEDEAEQEALESSADQPSAPQPNPTSSSNMPPASGQAPKKKFATLGDLRGSAGPSHAGHGHGHDDDDDDEDYEPSDDENQNLYAGGEKSGLAVENPDDLKKKIIERAKKNVARPGGDDPRAPSSRFIGTARTLGGDDTPSEVIPDPTVSRPQRTAPVERVLHFWADGFSVDDGPLFRADDPANAAILAQIKQGRAPMSILNVENGQEVDVKLDTHTEKYVQPKKKYVPFSGGGQRLGSPTPGAGTRTEMPAAPAPQAAAAPAAASQPAGPIIDDSQPTVSLQIRLGDGTRLPARFNTTHTIGDVYSFVTASNTESRTRSWALMTTFPSKELTDKSQALGDLAEFKRGGVVVQKWQ
ncbi:hypothetical protein OEA41_003595 [Lepraria neglecta]|uniref:SEP-domain-containing protein n=1 Tax=Lepraria neglecta TaxID=209136 RepID=A0AAD9Z4Y5_9LECA|nr:hypothetical protein OEA41_003595 [Lepraria neglecta]